MEIGYTISELANNYKIKIFVKKGSKPLNVNLSAVITTDDNKEYVFLPNNPILNSNNNPTYPEPSMNMVIQTSLGEYLIYHLSNKRPIKLRIFAEKDNIIEEFQSDLYV